ncbi:MAG TPA: hypothetical protein VFY45_14320 [Baekduia sp.]|nr:hypothetical protein [Baekduia sp.]
MSLLEPLWISEGAWSALRDQVIGPEAAVTADPDVLALARAWNEPVRDGNRVGVGVFVDAELARTLSRLLDAHPSLAAELLG